MDRNEETSLLAQRIDEDRVFIKTCFESLYNDLLENNAWALSGESKRVSGLDLGDGGVPEEMEAGEVNEEHNVRWKLVPSRVSEKDIEAIEKIYGLKFPLLFKAFLSTYYHLFGYVSEIASQPSDRPFGEYEVTQHPILTKYNYLAFAWDSDGYYIHCIDLSNMPNEEQCAVMEIDHEYLFNFDEEKVTKEEVEQHMQKVNNNFREYLSERFFRY